MEESILKSTKKILGLQEDYTPFDHDVTTHINSALATLNQLGVGPAVPLVIEDAEAKWTDLELPAGQLSHVKTYLYLKVRMLFDPPATSFVIEALNKQIEEHEVRLNHAAELLAPPVSEEVIA